MAHFKSFAFLVLLLSCSLYSYYLSNKDFQWIVPYMNDRSPAAVRDSIDFKNIIEKPMRVFKRENVASSIAIQKKDDKKFFAMGQFPVAGINGENLICLEYPIIKLKFSGEGMAVNGKKTQAWLTAPCKVSEKNQDYISEIPLPFGEMSRWSVQNQEVDYSQPNMPVKIKFDQVYTEWPVIWQLDSVEFYRDTSEAGDKVIFSHYDFLKKLGEVVLVK